MCTVNDGKGPPNRGGRDEEEVARIHRTILKKGLNDLDNCNGVVTHLEPDILEYEITWASTKIVEVMEFQLSYFKS